MCKCKSLWMCALRLPVCAARHLVCPVDKRPVPHSGRIKTKAPFKWRDRARGTNACGSVRLCLACIACVVLCPGVFSCGTKGMLPEVVAPAADAKELGNGPSKDQAVKGAGGTAAVAKGLG